MAIYFRVADHREVPSSEALDERGILRHGYGQRVPHAMRDAAPRFAWDANRDALLVTDGRRIGGVEGNRPGFRIFADDDMGRQAVADARAAYIRDLENAWRGDAAKPRRDPKDEDDEDDDTGSSNMPQGELEQMTSASSDSRRMLDVHAMSAAHVRAMDAIYRQISEDVSQQWRRRK